MPAVKTEEFHLRVPSRAFPSRSPSSLSLSTSPTIRARQFAAERNARLRANASPYSRNQQQQRQQTPQNTERSRERQQPQIRNEESVYALNGSNEPLVRILGHATHEMLSSSGNVAYTEAVKALSHARNEAMEYRRQNIDLTTKLTETRSAYDQLVKQYRVLHANLEQHIQQQQQQQQLLQQQTMAMHVPQAKVVQAPPTPQESPAATVNTAELHPQENYGPIAQPGGFQLKPLVGAYNETSSVRPADVAPEACWTKADWFGKGYSNGSFVRDRNGNYLKHLMRGIRGTARKIWNEVDNRGYTLGKSFNKNGANFMDAYIGTIEEIYPCLRLCAGHWKAKQIGIRTYPHWYAGRNKRQASASTASGSTAT